VLRSRRVKSYDTIIIGGGIVGLALARELRARDAKRTIAVLDKEPALGRHASGRNSGVLHSGIYYPPASLKGRLCNEGARLMRAYCEEHGLPVAPTGKLIVPSREGEDAQLDSLLERARANGAQAEIVGEREIAELEPEAHSASGRALFSPNTCVVDPKAVMSHLGASLRDSGVDILLGCEFRVADDDTLLAGDQRLAYGTVINAAGLHADRVAQLFGCGLQYTILPFKGLYYQLDPNAPIKIRRLIYPVPDLRVPFLGVHFTVSTTGNVYAGPTAIPALGRENYRGTEGISPRDLTSIGATIVRQYASNKQGFRTLVHEEGRRFIKRYFADAARALVPRLKTEYLVPCTKVGIRAQLFDREKQELVMDFLVERGERSLHVLNAVSPGFTSAFSFARYVLDGLDRAA
jgi:L-2-hydroxyglutarate oxidase